MRTKIEHLYYGRKLVSNGQILNIKKPWNQISILNNLHYENDWTQEVNEKSTWIVEPCCQKVTRQPWWSTRSEIFGGCCCSFSLSLSKSTESWLQEVWKLYKAYTVSTPPAHRRKQQINAADNTYTHLLKYDIDCCGAFVIFFHSISISLKCLSATFIHLLDFDWEDRWLDLFPPYRRKVCLTQY